MAPTSATTGRKVTPLAALFNMAVKNAGHPDLPTYLAVSRTPGTAWKSYDQIAGYLTELTGHPVNRVTVKNITEGTYGLPNTRYWGGHSQPHTVTDEQFEQYVGSLYGTPANRTYVIEARNEGTADETAAIVSDPDAMAAVTAGDAELADFDGDKRYRFADGSDDPEA